MKLLKEAYVHYATVYATQVLSVIEAFQGIEI